MTSSEYSNLGGKLSALGKHQDAFGKSLKEVDTKPLSKSLFELGERTSKLGSPLGFGGLGPLVSGFGAALADPITAVAVLSVALIAAGVAAVYLAAKAAIAVVEMADLARTQRILLGAVGRQGPSTSPASAPKAAAQAQLELPGAA